MIYVPIGHEIDPIMVGSWVIERQGHLCVGHGSSTSAPLQVVSLEASFVAGGQWHLEDAERDAWGMSVPRHLVTVSANSLDAVIVPGLAFDRVGNRLGRGKGVYDRFLATLPPSTRRIGLIPSSLVVDRLPVEPHDVPMHAVVTELGVIEPGR
jgi:5,10-methenyltetrahydrofolate synthetase